MPTSTTSSQIDVGSSQKREPIDSPNSMALNTLLTRTSTRPWVAPTSAKRAATAAASVKSHWRADAEPPAASISATVWFKQPRPEPLSVSVRPATTTWAPARPSSIAAPLPRPRLAPPTTATFPSNAPMLVSPISAHRRCRRPATIGGRRTPGPGPGSARHP